MLRLGFEPASLDLHQPRSLVTTLYLLGHSDCRIRVTNIISATIVLKSLGSTFSSPTRDVEATFHSSRQTLSNVDDIKAVVEKMKKQVNLRINFRTAETIARLFDANREKLLFAFPPKIYRLVWSALKRFIEFLFHSWYGSAGCCGSCFLKLDFVLKHCLKRQVSL